MLLLNISCKRKAYHSLVIKLDSTFDYRLYESVTVSSEKYITPLDPSESTSWHFDSITRERTFRWDSLGDDVYDFCFKTIFTKKQKLRFKLICDTTFHLKNELGIEKVDFINLFELKNADTIEFNYSTVACFGSNFERNILIKNKSSNNYILKTSSNYLNEDNQSSIIYHDVNSDIIDTIFQVQLEAKKRQDNKELLNFSTTRQKFFLLVNNKLFMFNDPMLEKSDLYKRLRMNL